MVCPAGQTRERERERTRYKNGPKRLELFILNTNIPVSIRERGHHTGDEVVHLSCLPRELALDGPNSDLFRYPNINIYIKTIENYQHKHTHTHTYIYIYIYIYIRIRRTTLATAEKVLPFCPRLKTKQTNGKIG